MSAGSFCKSASSVITIGARALRNPAANAAVCPALRSDAGGIAAGGASAVIPHPMRPLQPLPARSRWAAKPVAIASANGLRGVQKAFDMLMQGADTLDAVIEGVKIQELDPNDTTVGYGGLPNRDGVVQLDAS